MKVLVTGAAGFIGSHLVERLCANGHQVTGIDNFDSFLYDAQIKERNAGELVRLPGFHMVNGDICDRELVEGLCSGKELVVHLAALAGVRPSLQDPPRYARVNVEGTTNLLEGCRVHDIKKLVFASSSSVYGSRSKTDVPFREEDPCLTPASPYAATKRAGELLCSTYRDLYGIGISSLRFFTVYGPRQRPEMAIHKFVRLVDAGRPLPIYGDGTTARDYTFIDDIVDGIDAACQKVVPGQYEIYNLGGEQTTTLLQLATLIGGAMETTLRIERHPPQPGDVPITYADCQKAARELGYAPKVGIEEGITRFVEWFKKWNAR
jgi:UDP-glucuronate 4-epimerase